MCVMCLEILKDLQRCIASLTFRPTTQLEYYNHIPFFKKLIEVSNDQ